MYMDDLNIGLPATPPNGLEETKKAKATIKLDVGNGPAADSDTREYEDTMPSSWWNSDSGTFEPPPESPPSRRAAADAEVQAALSALWKHRNEEGSR